MTAVADADVNEKAWAVVSAVADPEIPVLTIADLGILREVRVDAAGRAEVIIIPTYSGCPAMNVIAQDIKVALAEVGFANAKVTTVLSPAWTTDFITEEGKEKLRAYGIAPPQRSEEQPACPQCGSKDTEKISQFGSTPCKALWRCRACREPFDYFKCL